MRLMHTEKYSVCELMMHLNSLSMPLVPAIVRPHCRTQEDS
jgi:hypothetical protein